MCTYTYTLVPQLMCSHLTIHRNHRSGDGYLLFHTYMNWYDLQLLTLVFICTGILHKTDNDNTLTIYYDYDLQSMRN